MKLRVALCPSALPTTSVAVLALATSAVRPSADCHNTLLQVNEYGGKPPETWAVTEAVSPQPLNDVGMITVSAPTGS